MVRGTQKLVSFAIQNTGQEALKNARIEGPSTPWMGLMVESALGDVAPGASKTVGLVLRPPSDLPQGVYDDRITIYSDNHIPYAYHVQVTVQSNAVGSVLFDVLNELYEDVPGASITFQHQELLELTYRTSTAADGTSFVTDIPEGRYVYNVSATGHSPWSGTFVVEPGLTTAVPIALEVDMVDIEWSVTPVVIEDRYEITITQTFETNVPAPVLIVEPPNINLPPMQPGEVFQGEFTVTNYGLIEVYDVALSFPTSVGDYDIEVLTGAVPDKIGAMQSVAVPYRITRRTQTASAGSSLFDEVRGYGGSPCPGSFRITVKGWCIICPNSAFERAVLKVVSYIVSFFDYTRDCTPVSVSGGFVDNWREGVSIISQWVGNQSGTGLTPQGTSSSAIKTDDCKKCENNKEVYDTPQKLDRGLRWMLACRNSEEERRDGKEKDA